MTASTALLLVVAANFCLLIWVFWPRRGGGENLPIINLWLHRIVAVLSAGMGIAFIVASFLWSVPQATDLAEVRGHLEGYSVRYSGRRSREIDIETDAGRCFTFAITEQRARDLLRDRGIPVHFYIDARSRHLHSGVPKAYGLSVGELEIQSPAAALEEERKGVRFGFPLFGALLISLSPFIYRRSQVSHLTNRWSE